jgi:hypothetical protein
MKKTNFSIQLAILVMMFGLATGCAGTKSKETQIAKDTASPADTAADRGGMSSYTVVSGDNLWNIAGSSSIYGDPYKWPLIYKANKSRISDADLIYPGQVFDIDQSPSSGEARVAVNHAKTRGAWSVGAAEVSDTRYLAQ